jgi:DNA-binding MarR family transcriptional regulator
LSTHLLYPQLMSRSGADLALLLLGGFRVLVDEAILELAKRGYEDVRPVHDFAMRAIAAGADNASELGRRLSVSKQAAAKTVAVLVERGYVARGADPLDARRKRLQVTALGFEVMREGEAVFDELREKWKRKIGAKQLERLESDLAALVGSSTVPIDSPGWIAHSLDETT